MTKRNDQSGAAALRRRVEAEENAALDAQFRILDLLAELGVTKKELADRLGVSKSSVSQLFAAGANPSVKQLARIFDALDCKLVLDACPLREGGQSTVPKPRDEVFEASSWEWESATAANENYLPQQAAA